jgi:hypothetical protein
MILSIKLAKDFVPLALSHICNVASLPKGAIILLDCTVFSYGMF